MTIARWVLDAEMKPRVVHRLPGRVRLRLPALTRIPDVHRLVVAQCLQRACLPEGLHTLRADLLTGSMLIRYDPERLDEQAVLTWVETLARAVESQMGRLLELPPERRATAADVLRQTVEQALDRGVPLGPGIVGRQRVRPA